MGQKFSEKILGLSTLDKEDLLKVYSAVLQAAQYDAFVSDGQSFRLLEGLVRKHKSGVYIFIPNQALKSMLEGKNLPKLLKIEESRFAAYIRLALDKDEPVQQEIKLDADFYTVRELPHSCDSCPRKKKVSFYDGDFYLCQHTHKQVDEYMNSRTRDSSCPLILNKKEAKDE